MDNPEKVKTNITVEILKEAFLRTDGTVADRVHTNRGSKEIWDIMKKGGLVTEVPPVLGNTFGLQITVEGRALIAIS